MIHESLLTWYAFLAPRTQLGNLGGLPSFQRFARSHDFRVSLNDAL
jgi:hypothetical protein